MLFLEITPEYLNRFEISLQKAGRAPTTIAINLRNIRMVYNKAIDAGIADLNSYPFRRFKIKEAKSRDRDMEVEEIRKLKDKKLVLGEQIRARDLFMLSFYLCGLNFKDLLLARKRDVKNGRLEIDRAKTSQPLSIKITPQAQEIIDLYPGEKYLLYFMERKLKALENKGRTTPLYKDITDQTNRHLRKISKELKFPFKLSTNYARHTWSSIAFNECGVSEEIIGLALGHASIRPVTAGYIKKKYELVDEANEKVIGELYKKQEP